MCVWIGHIREIFVPSIALKDKVYFFKKKNYWIGHFIEMNTHNQYISLNMCFISIRFSNIRLSIPESNK